MNLYLRLTFIENHHSVIRVEMDDGKCFCDLIKEVKSEYGYSEFDADFGAQLVVRTVQWGICAFGPSTRSQSVSLGVMDATSGSRSLNFVQNKKQK